MAVTKYVVTYNAADIFRC